VNPARRRYPTYSLDGPREGCAHAFPDVAAGAKIFRSHCAECQGFAGAGGKAPKLTTGVFFHGGIPGTAMPGVFFSPDQVWRIVADVRSPGTGGAQRGAQLFHQQECSGCHLARGEGGVRGPDLSMIGSPGPNVNFAYSPFII